MARYNMRTLRGERVIKKKEGTRIKRWEFDYKRFINDARNVLSVEEVTDDIRQTFENNAIEQEKVSLICPLTKERIAVPVRYRNCRHLQCFDLKGFLAMKTEINFLNCPICNTVVDNALEGLCIDKFFQKILSDISGATEIEILSDGTFRVAPSHSAPIIPKVIDDEEPYEPEHSTTLTREVKLESDSDVEDIEELGSISSFDNDSEANESDTETQDMHIADTSIAGDTSQAVDHSTTHIDGIKLETDNNVDNDKELGSDSSFSIDDVANESNAETQILHISDSSMAGDTNQAAHTSNAKVGSKIDEKRFECGICSYSTNNSHNLLTHSRIHTGEKPHKCDQCSYACAKFGNLKTHMLTHTGEKPHKCSQCSYTCAQAIHLANHMRTHTGEKPFKCNLCSYACTVSSSLKAHMRTHTGEKPYKCSQCSYACATAGHLKMHILTHTGEKPHKCRQCSYASAHPVALKTHIRTHTGEKPFKCSQCSYAAAHAANLKRHMRTHV